jgi:HlyD family secretion protein
MKSSKKILWLLAPVIFGAVGWQTYRMLKTEPVAPSFRTEKVTRGDLVEYISATGTIEPEELVDVGAQVGGMISEFGHDESGREVDYGSQVKSGMVLARIDDSLYSAESRQSEAQLLQAKANLASNLAQLNQLKAKLELATNNFERSAALLPTGSTTKAENDASKAELSTAKANVEVGMAAIEQSKAAIASAEASCDRTKRNLSYCVIKSPVDGVIIDRRVNIGQTVVSSMSAPSLFLIAKDLRRMEIWVSVNEADIGQIKPGQKTVFTVDAFAGQKFFGQVEKIRLNASMSQNVVTYVVEVSTDNSDGKLLPYLTASVDFIIAERSAVLRVPNTALRFKPDPALVSPKDRELLAQPSSVRRGGRRSSDQPAEAVVWTLKNGLLKGVAVTTGLTDGVNTEILSGELAEGAVVVTGMKTADEASAEAPAGTPFLPQFKRRP